MNTQLSWQPAPPQYETVSYTTAFNTAIRIDLEEWYRFVYTPDPFYPAEPAHTWHDVRQSLRDNPDYRWLNDNEADEVTDYILDAIDATHDVTPDRFLPTRRIANEYYATASQRYGNSFERNDAARKLSGLGYDEPRITQHLAILDAIARGQPVPPKRITLRTIRHAVAVTAHDIAPERHRNGLSRNDISGITHAIAQHMRTAVQDDGETALRIAKRIMHIAIQRVYGNDHLTSWAWTTAERGAPMSVYTPANKRSKTPYIRPSTPLRHAARVYAVTHYHHRTGREHHSYFRSPEHARAWYHELTQKEQPS